MPTPEFILRLRAKIGHDPLWLPGVTAVVLDDRRRVLLVRRADSGLWTLVTGCLDPGEQPAVGAVREVWEETGVRVAVERALRIEALPPVTYPNGDQAQYIDTAFQCRVTGGVARVNDDESSAVGWFDPADLPALNDRERACVAAALDGTPEFWFERPPEC